MERMIACMATLTDIYQTDRVTSLLVRYWGVGRRLDDEEKDALLEALDAENKALLGPIHRRALDRMRELGIE